jgi:hypothetical protein
MRFSAAGLMDPARAGRLGLSQSGHLAIHLPGANSVIQMSE